IGPSGANSSTCSDLFNKAASRKYFCTHTPFCFIYEWEGCREQTTIIKLYHSGILSKESTYSACLSKYCDQRVFSGFGFTRKLA
ncbi:MAG: hypothetical protein N6V49_02415, partial [Serratia symbiotica]|nr:hypothetical protein [Serratia symbiotica]